MMTEREVAGVLIRAAEERDTLVLLRLIHDFADYEGRPDICVVTESALLSALFGPRPLMHAILAEDAGAIVGYALVFAYFAPYPGVISLFMEHLYVVESRRGQGIGRVLLQHVARIAVECGAERLVWGVLQANEPAIGFYTRFGATLVDDFMACRLEGDALRRVAGGE